MLPQVACHDNSFHSKALVLTDGGLVFFIDVVYPESMTISLMNAGRGAGKTHALIAWAIEKPNRYVVGNFNTRIAMNEVNALSQFVSYANAREFFRGYQNFEVAFDDFDKYVADYLAREFHIFPQNPAILATNIPEWEGAPETGFATLPKEYAEKLVAQYGHTTLNPLLGVVNPGSLMVDGDIHPEKVEPDTKKVSLDELCLGDVIVGKGRVISLALDYQTVELYKIVVGIKANGFSGTLSLPGSSLVEIENR